MKINHIEGNKKDNVILYTLSTCVWCKKTKKYLNELGIEYSYIDVDLLEADEKEEVLKKIKKFVSANSFPITIINDKECIVGFKPEKIKETLDL
ncbi:MAG: NrdH-redoxin [Elusimicrobia bacterium RIFOXYC2_FULL_34_12]|nr:MAG: NrdH-redoxin [Elusimicrobia bacterium RIFOXYC2_FULL_34_12]HAM38366.1 glutaredoxin family protein [Elusimicrobiota bacterium]